MASKWKELFICLFVCLKRTNIHATKQNILLLLQRFVNAVAAGRKSASS